MIQSMTGFGKSVLQLPGKKITIEIKSLNSKNLDLNARIPGAYRAKELDMRTIVAKSLNRGKIDFGLYVESTGAATTSQINPAAVQNYISQLQQITQQEPAALLDIAMRLPEVIKTEREEIDENEFSEILKGLKIALQEINTYRSDEGAALQKDFDLRIKNLTALLQEVITVDVERLKGIKERLEKAVTELKTAVDENRFEQELVFYLEKYDITEEKVRLENHLAYFTQAINSSDSNGKKLGFICQEIGREINTIGSKSNFAPMQQLVVQMKDELEKIKEQVLNVL